MAKALATSVLLLYWQTFFWKDFPGQHDVVEFYAGVGRIARLAANFGYTAVAFDCVYDQSSFLDRIAGHPGEQERVRAVQSRNGRAMDLTEPAGFTPLV